MPKSAEERRAANAARQARYRAARRRGLRWDDAQGARVNPEPHEPSDTEYKAGCGCGGPNHPDGWGCRDEHALYERLRYHQDSTTTPLALSELGLAYLAALARQNLERVVTVPPPPPPPDLAATPAPRSGRHHRHGRHRADA